MNATSLNNAMQAAMGKRRGKPWIAYQVAHGFRALGVSMGQAYVTHEGQTLNKAVLDVMAAHKLGDKLGTAYERNGWEELREPYWQAWADWLDQVKAGDPLALMKASKRPKPVQVAPDRYAELLALEAMVKAGAKVSQAA